MAIIPTSSTPLDRPTTRSVRRSSINRQHVLQYQQREQLKQQQQQQQQPQQLQPQLLEQSRQRNHPKKKVCIRLEMNEQYEPSWWITKELKQKVWWSRTDIKMFRSSCAIQAGRSSDDTNSQIQTVYGACALASSNSSVHSMSSYSTSSTESSESSISSDEEDYKVNDDLMEACVKLSASSARGLEMIVFPAIMKDRKRAHQYVLNLQSRLPQEMHAHQKQDVLAAASRLVSKQSSRLALEFAKGDARIAQDLHKNKSTRSMPSSFVPPTQPTEFILDGRDPDEAATTEATTATESSPSLYRHFRRSRSVI